MASRSSKPINGLPNFHQLDSSLYRGGQPSEEGIRHLAGMGIKTIISFRAESSKVLREKRQAEECGMKFLNLHLSNWFAPDNKEIEEVLAEITNPQNQPVSIHCNRGADRTGTVSAIYRMKYEGWSARQANHEARELGLGWWQVWMKGYINGYEKKLRD